MADREIATTPLWWEIQNVPTQMIRELRRRKNGTSFGFSYPKDVTTINFDNSYSSYKGPLTPWVRVFSNSTGKPSNVLTPPSGYLIRKNDPLFQGYDGFILKGGDGFYDAFGYDNNTGLKDNKDKNATIGYQADGKPHYLNANVTQLQYSTTSDPKFPQNNSVPRILPPPGVTSVNVKQSKEFLTFATIKFKCYSLAQLEYLTPFFLNPGINLFVEFGWNLFNQKSLVNLKEPNDCWKLISKPQTALDLSNLSNGNYGCVTGIITKYKFSTNDGFVYDCDVEMTSRQGLYAGMKTDNVVTTSIKSEREQQDEKVYLNLKNFCKIYLPAINDVIKNKQNFYIYIKNNFELIADKYSKSNKGKEDANANAEQIKAPVASIINNDTNGKDDNRFYGGKSEDRIFTGRRIDVYGKAKSPEDAVKVNQVYVPPSRSPVALGYLAGGEIKYKVIEYKLNDNKKQISFFDQHDFDAKDNNDEVWLQLDFVFEMFNLFMSNGLERFKVDISDIVINAHPNLMPLNKDLLIPNPVSPKINKGRNKGINLQGKPTGYLKNEASIVGKNKYLNLKADIDINSNKIQRVLEKQKNNETLTDEDGYILSSFVTKNKFKTQLYERDNIDTIINYLYYDSKQTGEQTGRNEFGSAAFPFYKEKTVGNTKYKPYYYGYFKNLLISKTKLIEIVTQSKTNNYKDVIKSLLNFINNSVDDFWKLDIVERTDGQGLSIVDKNGVGKLNEIYMFDIASTNNVIRSINFDVNTSNEQAINVLFGGPVDKNTTQQLKDDIKNTNTTSQYESVYSRLTNEPLLKFVDRMDKFELQNFLANQSASINTTVAPGTPDGLVDENNDIAHLQTYGPNQDVLTMQVKFIDEKPSTPNTNTPFLQSIVDQVYLYIKNIQDAEDNLNIKFLNWPESMKGMLRAILTDGDIDNNVKYSGVADNFQLTIVFDGLFGFRNLQCFAISNLPKPYVPGNVIFQILEAEHNIESGKWTTTVTALVRSVGGNNYDYITV